MNNPSLEILYHNLISSLWEELIIFIPDNEFSNEFLINQKELDFKKLHNKVLIIDYQKGPKLYEMGRENNPAIFKGNTLKKSIRQLLNAKVNSNELEFNYILELYYEQAECLYFICKWLNDNIHQILPQEDTILGLFKLQYNFYQAHFETILKQFYPDMQSLPKGNFNIGKSLESSFPHLSKLFDTKDKQITTTNDSNFQGNLDEGLTTLSNDKTKSRKLKKQPVISDSEAETLLLKRIFKIDPKIFQ